MEIMREASMSFGARLRQERARLGLTQLAFAELGGVKRVSQHLYEQDVRVPDVNYLLRLPAHGVDVGFLMSGKHSPTSAAGELIPRRRAVKAFRAVEEFSNSRGTAPLPYPEREQLFESLCTVLAEDDADRDLSRSGTGL